MKRAFSVKYRTTAVHDGPMLPRILLVRIARSVLECAWLATAFSRAACRARPPGYFMPRAAPKAAAPLRAAAALQNLAESGRLVLLLGLLLFALPALGLDWRPIPAGRVAKLSLHREGKTGFTRMPAAALGITFTNLLADERGITNRNLLSGSGVACGDVDGDGWCDLYFCGLDAGNQLYRNLGGWRFTNVTAMNQSGKSMWARRPAASKCWRSDSARPSTVCVMPTGRPCPSCSKRLASRSLRASTTRGPSQR